MTQPAASHERPLAVHVFLSGHTTDEYSGIGGVHVRLDEIRIRDLLAKFDRCKALRAEDDRFAALEYYDYSATYLDTIPDDDPAWATVEEEIMDGVGILHTALPMEEITVEGIDAERLYVTPHGIGWVAGMKHASYEVSSGTLYPDKLRAALLYVVRDQDVPAVIAECAQDESTAKEALDILERGGIPLGEPDEETRTGPIVIMPTDLTPFLTSTSQEVRQRAQLLLGTLPPVVEMKRAKKPLAR